MANILKVTTPVTERPSLNPVRPDSAQANDVRIQNPVSTREVTRGDGRNDASGQTQEQKLNFNYESNFHAFVRALGREPESVGALARLLQSGTLFRVESGIGSDTAKQLSGFLQMISTSENGMGEVVANQAQASSRFSGPFFDLLRQVLSDGAPADLERDVLNFLKKYTDASSAEHLRGRMQHMLQECADRMLKNPAQELMKKSGGFLNGTEGNIRTEVRLFKEEILPFLNRYIAASHDRGELRELTARLSALLARYENADRAGLAESFGRLTEYAGFRKYFGNMDGEQFLRVLDRLLENGKKEDPVSRSLLDMIDRGLSGAGGLEARQAAGSMLRSMLLGESVFMPVRHMIFPMNVDGRMLYSEMWVDPDAGHPDGSRQEGRAVKALIKFDIEGVGFFDLFLFYYQDKVDMQLNYPEEFRPREKEIRDRLGSILAERGISCNTLALGSSRESIPLSEAFPEIYERRNTVNVRV